MSCYVGLDIGGTKLLVASAEQDGAIIRRVRQDTPVDLQEGISLLHQMIAEVAAGRPIAGIGAAIGGPMDWQTGIVSPLHQPLWNDVPLRQLMQHRWNCPFTVDVDTNVAALGEYFCGGHDVPRLLYLTISTGMGGGFVVDGRIYRGAGGGHPEVAHQSVHSPFPRCQNVPCPCGSRNCLEALVSGNGIKALYHKPAEALTAAEWAEVEHNLAEGLRNLAAILLPDLIVLGGGIACARGQQLIDSLNHTLQERVRIVACPEIRLSKLGYDTALTGAIEISKRGLE